MSEPALAIQGAVIAALKLSRAGELVGGRVYDDPPVDSTTKLPTFPYVAFGEAQTIPERADCLDGSEHYFTIHVWSRAKGFPEAKRIADAVRGALHDANLTIPGFGLADLALETAQYMRDPDGLTSHAALSFRALVDPTD